jgi:hypothetical protein
MLNIRIFGIGKTKPILRQAPFGPSSWSRAGQALTTEDGKQKIEEKMQNKANLLNVQMVLKSNITRNYDNFKSLMQVKNKANSKPILQQAPFGSNSWPRAG